MEKIKTFNDWVLKVKFTLSGGSHFADEYGQYCYEQGVKNALELAGKRAETTMIRKNETEWEAIVIPDSILSLEQELLKNE